MFKNEKVVVFFIAFLILGVAMGMQVRSIFNEKKLKDQTTYKAEELKTFINDEKMKREKLKSQIDENEKKFEKYLKNEAEIKNDDVMKQQVEYLESLKLKAGLTDVKGPGVTIKLEDAAVRMAGDVKDQIVHDGDIISILNELKKVGAQAISINGERVLPMSEQVCAGPTIRINRTKYSAPFIIEAIGNPEDLFEQIDKSEVAYWMRKYNIKIEIEKSAEMIISKYNYDINNLISGLEVLN